MLVFFTFQVVVEEFIYSGTIGILTPYNPEYISIKSDGDGKTIIVSLFCYLVKHCIGLKV
jgi:DNA-binding transcriptional MocR family regulator